jgi:hypothetical protein
MRKTDLWEGAYACGKSQPVARNKKEMVKVARVEDATRSCAMHRYDNNFIARLINIFFDVDERKKERYESLV